MIVNYSIPFYNIFNKTGKKEKNNLIICFLSVLISKARSPSGLDVAIDLLPEISKVTCEIKLAISTGTFMFFYLMF